ncbi:MAG: YlxR family protein [Polyangia bacterium]
MPQRTCTGCRRVDEQAKLMRLVVDGNGRVRVDKLRMQPGRGAYVHLDRTCVEKMVRDGGLQRSFRKRTQPLEGGRLWAFLTEEEEGS